MEYRELAEDIADLFLEEEHRRVMDGAVAQQRVNVIENMIKDFMANKEFFPKENP
mgnify:FL=1|jgi:hypothetical protein